MGGIEKQTQDIINKIAEPLLRLADIANRAIKIEEKDGRVGSRFDLTPDELYALAIKIPAECVYLQTVLNEHSAKQSFVQMAAENEVTKHVVSYYGGKGDARERLRRGELEERGLLEKAMMEKLIAKGLQQIIERADRLYEGIKKVIDAKNRESNFDNKIH